MMVAGLFVVLVVWWSVGIYIGRRNMVPTQIWSCWQGFHGDGHSGEDVHGVGRSRGLLM